MIPSQKSLLLIFIVLLHQNASPMRMQPTDTNLCWLEGQRPEDYLAAHGNSAETNHRPEPQATYTWTMNREYDIPQRVSHESNYPIESMPAQNSSESMRPSSYDTFDDLAHCNIQQTLKDDAIIQQDNQANKAILATEFSKAPPEISLEDTLDKVRAALHSKATVARLTEMMDFLIKKNESFFTLNAAENYAQCDFISKFLDGTVLKLLNEIQFGNIQHAGSAFNKLRNLWPYKHKQGFFVRECHSAEAQLINILGVDFMQKAEISLISHPNYLASFYPRLHSEFKLSKATYQIMQKRGCADALAQVERNIVNRLKTEKRMNNPLAKAQAIALRVLLDNPLTEVYATIANGTPIQSDLALNYIKNQTAEHYAKLNITDPARISADLVAAVGYDTLQTAQFLHETREDFEKALECEKSRVVCSPENLNQAITHTSELIQADLSPMIKAFLDNRIIAFKEMANGKAVISNQEYKLSNELSAKLHEQGIDPHAFKECRGNQVQQAIHQECIFSLEQIVIANEYSIIVRLAEPLIQLAEAARMYSKDHSLLEAISITDFCLILIDYDLAILDGIRNGVVGTLSDFREHPLETAATVIYGKGVLVYQLASHVCDAIGLGILAIENQKAAKTKLKEYIKPIKSLVTQIKKKQVSIRDVIAGTSELGTKLFLQNKVLGGLNSIFTGIQNRALAFMKNNPLARAEKYLVTSDGMLLKAAGGHGKNKPLLKYMGGKGPKNTNNTKQAILKVGIKDEFFVNTKFGQELDKISSNVRGSKIFKLNDKLSKYGLDKGDQYYLDLAHRDHIEVFKSSGKIRMVLNLDGTYNAKKTAKALKEKRNLYR